MITNDFFDRIIHLGDVGATRQWMETRRQCVTRGLTKMEMVQMGNPNSNVMPHSATFTKNELAELLSFYKVILAAQTDRINHLLILKGEIKFRKDYAEREEQVLGEIPHEWDMIYWAHDTCQLTTTEKKTNLVQRVFFAEGTRALAINNSFYPVFLESARIPLYNLQEHIRSISLALHLFATIPPLVVDIKTKYP